MYGVLGASASGLIIANLLVRMPEEHLPITQSNDLTEEEIGLPEGLSEDLLDDESASGDHPMPVVFSTYHLTNGGFDSLQSNKVIHLGKGNPMFFWKASDQSLANEDVSFTWADAVEQVDIEEGATLGYDTKVDAATGGNELIKSVETSEIAKKFRDYGVYPVDESVYGVSSKYGPRVDPISGKEKVFHTGLDIWSSNINQQNIYSVLPGAVSRVSYHEAGFGHHVVIDHGDFKTLYAHMTEKPAIEVGDVVSAGDKIGSVGTTGRSTGPHLHLEVDINGVKIDPEPFMSLVGQPGNKNKPKNTYTQATEVEEETTTETDETVEDDTH